LSEELPEKEEDDPAPAPDPDIVFADAEITAAKLA
jgi:hypothetical protein